VGCIKLLAVDILKSDLQARHWPKIADFNLPHRYGVNTPVGCILAQPGKYDWPVHVRRRCGLMSNYFDHLFNFGTQL